MFGTQFNYLKLQVDSDYRNGREGVGVNAVRTIFKNQVYDKFEKQMIQELKNLMKLQDLFYNPQSQTDDILLRYLYACEFNIQDAYQQFFSCLRWFQQNPHVFRISQDIESIFQRGSIYIQGRDLNYKPTLVIKTRPLEGCSIATIEQALTIVMAIMEDYMFQPGKVEQWVVIIQTEEQAFYNSPFQEIAQMINNMQNNFPNTLDKLYIMNPSLQLQQSCQGIQNIIAPLTQTKIVFLNQSSLHILTQNYDLNHLEVNLGGRRTYKHLGYWPPDPAFFQYQQQKQEQQQYQSPQFQQIDAQVEPRFSSSQLSYSQMSQTQIQNNSLYQRQSDQYNPKDSVRLSVVDSFVSYKRKYESYIPYNDNDSKQFEKYATKYTDQQINYEQINDEQINDEPLKAEIQQPRMSHTSRGSINHSNKSNNDHHDCYVCQQRDKKIQMFTSQIQSNNDQPAYKNPFFSSNDTQNLQSQYPPHQSFQVFDQQSSAPSNQIKSYSFKQNKNENQIDQYSIDNYEQSQYSGDQNHNHQLQKYPDNQYQNFQPQQSFNQNNILQDLSPYGQQILNQPNYDNKRSSNFGFEGITVNNHTQARSESSLYSVVPRVTTQVRQTQNYNYGSYVPPQDDQTQQEGYQACIMF